MPYVLELASGIYLLSLTSFSQFSGCLKNSFFKSYFIIFVLSFIKYITAISGIWNHYKVHPTGFTRVNFLDQCSVLSFCCMFHFPVTISIGQRYKLHVYMVWLSFLWFIGQHWVFRDKDCVYVCFAGFNWPWPLMDQ